MKNTTKAFIALMVLIAGVTFSALGQQSVKVLFIGNSFTYYSDLPGKFKNLSVAAGKTVTVDSYANAGQMFAGSSGHANSPTTYAKIRSQSWDYVVLQDNQGSFAVYQNQVTSTNMAANMRLRDSVRAIHPCARVIWFVGWGPKGGVFTGDNTTNELNRIDSNYQYMHNMYPSKKEVMAPLGKSWIASMAAKPALNLYYSDDVHPGLAGQYLNASVLYTTIFKQDPSAINYIPTGLSSADAAFLRNIAYTTVTTPYIYNSHVMPSNTPVVTNNAGTLSVPSTYASYQWYKNNVAISGATSSSYAPATSGSYCVMASTSLNGCAQNLSFAVTITSTTGINENTLLGNVSVYPNPVSDVSVIELKGAEWEGCSIEITNLFGQKIISSSFISDRFFIHRNDFSPGMYLYVVTDQKGNSISGKISVP